MVEIPPFYDKKYTCLMCKQTFTTKKIRSRFIKVAQYDSDFCPHYESEEMNPMLYYVNVCPHCGFSFSDDFSPYFAPGTFQLLEEKVNKQWVPQDFGGLRDINSAIKTLKLASFCATLKSEKHIVTAGLYMRLTWLFRTLKNGQQEERFMKLALDEYTNSYLADDFLGTQVTDVRLLYIIGELSRRTGQIDEAVKYFSKVIEKQKYSTETRIVEMARDRWHEIRESRKSTEKETTNA